MSGRLVGKVALITGGAGGIGSATAQLFCEQGARVLIVDRDANDTRATAERVRTAMPEATIEGAAFDLAIEASAAEAVRAAVEAFGGIDILVNNAGIRAYEPLAEARSETWQRIIAVNLLSYAYLAREAVPGMRAAGGGSIVNVSSTHAMNPRAGMGQYDVTKSGIISFTRILAAEEARHGIRVNAVCPGPTLTPFHVQRAEAAGRSGQDLVRDRRTDCLLGRWADPREVAFPILWQASGEASYVTGTAIMADGGMPVI